MEIEKAVIHRLQRERKRERAVALRCGGFGRRGRVCHQPILQIAFDLRKSRHGAERHICFLDTEL